MYLEGETLRDRLERGPLSLREILCWGRQIGSALDAAHRAGVLHRDLKPGNVMLVGKRREPDAKLLDFGIAKLLEPAVPGAAQSSDPTLTLAGAVVGTPQYMSPEQIQRRELDPRSDLFSFGAVLYEMAAGRPPFEMRSWAPGAISSSPSASRPFLPRLATRDVRLLNSGINR